MRVISIVFLTLIVWISNHMQAMKTSQPTEPERYSREKKMLKAQHHIFVPFKPKYQQDSPKADLIKSIQKQIYLDSDPEIMANLLWKEKNPMLDQEDRNKLYEEAIDLEKLSTTQNTPIETSYFTKKNYLYAFKFFPSLIFPTSFFTPTPYKRLTDKRPNLSEIIEALVKNEQEETLICCYHFNHKKLGESIVSQKNKGISIEIVTDQLQDQWILYNLGQNGIPIFSPKNDKFEQMHHKFFIFKKNLLNKTLLVIGSYNPTTNGDTRSWDDITIIDNPAIIDQYIKRFEEVRARSQKIY